MKRGIFSLLLILFVAMFFATISAQGTWVAPSKDTFTYYNSITGAGGDEIHGADALIRVRSDYIGNAGTDMHFRDAYLQFDLDPGLFKEDVKQAFLKLTINRWYNQRAGYHGQFSLYDMGETGWDEMTLTYNNSPWSNANPGEPIANTNAYGYIAQIASADPVMDLVFDITKYVWAQLDAGNTSFTIVLADITGGTEEGNGTDARMYSKDATPLDEKAPDSTYFPYVVLNENPMFKGYTRIEVAEDTYSDVSSPADPHNDWRVRVRASTTNKRDTYLKFNLAGSGFSTSADVDEALLSLTAERIVGAGNDLFYGWPLDDNSWTEDALSWDNAPWNKEMAKTSLPIFFSDTLQDVSSSDPVGVLWFDITSYVKAQLDSGNTEFSMVLSDTSYGESWNNDGDLRIYGKESLTSGQSPTDWWKLPEEAFVPAIYVKGLVDQVGSLEANQPLTFDLFQNYPNPFNPTTTISYQLSKSGRVDIAVMDILGRNIRTLESGVKSGGVHQIEWDGKNTAGSQVASGIYFTRITAENNTKMIKMVLIR